MQIHIVILTLYDGEVHVGIRYVQPTHDVVVSCRKLVEVHDGKIVFIVIDVFLTSLFIDDFDLVVVHQDRNDLIS